MKKKNNSMRIVDIDDDDYSIFPHETIIFNVQGMYVPSQKLKERYIIPWSSYIMDDSGMVKIESLTFGRLLSYAIQNSIVKILFRIKYNIYVLGFIKGGSPHEPISFKNFTLKFYVTLKDRKRENKLNDQYFTILDEMEKIGKH